MLRHLLNVQHFDLIGTIIPHSDGGLYYRPMIMISFLIDRFVWNLNPSIMHLENILLHLACSLQIFLIARLAFTKTRNLSLPAALIFAIHPIATESVNWISGRTDLLAVMFMLASLYAILCFRHYNNFWWLAAAVATLVFGIMSKETAIAFIPALVFIMTAKMMNPDQLKELKGEEIEHAMHIPRQSLMIFISVCILALGTALFIYNYYISIVIVLLYFFYLLFF